MYDNAHDANMRLTDSIIMYRGKPVYIHGVREDEELTVVMSFLTSGEEQRVPIVDKGFDLTPVGTGYVNFQRSTMYLQRTPARRWKQGLNRESVEIVGTVLGRSAQDLINTKEMADTILNKYPSYGDTLENVRSGRLTMSAYHRMFALSKSELGILYLWYRGEKAGWIEQERPILGDRYQYLAEELQGAMP